MIGDRVRTLRESHGWTQEHLADVSGVSTRTIQRVEAKHAYSGETAMALASAFSIDVQDLVAPGPASSGEHQPLWPAPAPQIAAEVAIALATPGALLLISIVLKDAGFATPINALDAAGRLLGLVPNYWFLWPIPLLILPAAGATLVLGTLIRIFGRVESGSIVVTGVELCWNTLAMAALLLCMMTIFPPAANLFGDMLARAAQAPLD